MANSSTAGLEPRLIRLVASGLCGSKDTKKYQAQLAELVERTSGDKDLKSQEEIFNALSDRVRLKMMYALMSREMCECEIMVALGMTQPTASRQLSILERAHLVSRSRRGKWAFYRAAGTSLEDVLARILVGAGTSAPSD
jgi:DNA-binding transcriptional ArsR family regulator